MESKIAEIDVKKEYLIFFPSYNSELVLFKLQKAKALANLHKHPNRTHKKSKKYLTQ